MMKISVLESSNVEKDLSVRVSIELKCGCHMDYLVLKAN